MALPREQVLEQIDTLLAEFDRARSAATYDDLSGGLRADDLGAIRTRMRAAISRMTSEGSDYARAADRTDKTHHGHAVISLTAVLRALRADVEAGYTHTLEELVHADLFSDFLEMAEELQRGGYKDAAAVIAGSTLEEHLRKLAARTGVAAMTPNGTPKKASGLNDELALQGAYNALEKKSVTAWQALRNDAAHGNYGEYDHKQVAGLIQGVRDFMVRHPA
jgi:hypothetical protein